MRISDTRPLKRGQVAVRRRRTCPECKTTFQTEEHARLWVTREAEREPFSRAVLLGSLERAAAGARPLLTASRLQEVVGSIVAGVLADGEFELSTDSIRRRTGAALLNLNLDFVAYRYDESLDPQACVVVKQGARGKEPFERAKLARSIRTAASKFFDQEAVEAVVEQIEAQLGERSGAVTTAEIRRLVSLALQGRDERAFLRYALGGQPGDESLDEFLERTAPTAQIRKRDGSVVLFSGEKLGKSLRLSFAAEVREGRSPEIAEFVAEEQRRVRHKMASSGAPERTSEIGKRALVWLFARDEFAWADYWLAFESDRSSGTSPAQQLADARARMRELLER